MDLISVLQVLRRRWIVFGGALLVTAVTAVTLAQLDTATYSSQGSVVIVRGPGAVGPAGVEGADPALQQAARLLAEVASGSGALRGLDDAETVNVTVDPNLAIIRLTGVAPESSSANENVQAVADGLEQQLEELLASGGLSVPGGAEMRTLVAPTTPESQQSEDGNVEFVSTATLLFTRADATTGPMAPVSGIVIPSQSERFVAQVIYERLLDDAVLRQMAEDGATGDFEVSLDDDSAILRVATSSPDAEEALVTGQVVVESMQQIAGAVQEADGIPEDLRFRVEPLAFPLVPFVSDSGFRTVLAVVALGLLASLGVSLMVDAAAVRRETRWYALASAHDTAADSRAKPTGGRARQNPTRTQVPSDFSGPARGR